MNQKSQRFFKTGKKRKPKKKSGNGEKRRENEREIFKKKIYINFKNL
jgi:hypothetical protein